MSETACNKDNGEKLLSCQPSAVHKLQSTIQNSNRIEVFLFVFTVCRFEKLEKVSSLSIRVTREEVTYSCFLKIRKFLLH